MASVFILQHCRTDESGDDHVKMIGVYSSRAEAERAVGRLKTQPGFVDCPGIVDPLNDEKTTGFHIDEYPLDNDHWQEGFVNV